MLSSNQFIKVFEIYSEFHEFDVVVGERCCLQISSSKCLRSIQSFMGLIFLSMKQDQND